MYFWQICTCRFTHVVVINMTWSGATDLDVTDTTNSGVGVVIDSDRMVEVNSEQ
jgi:hypothetical protein